MKYNVRLPAEWWRPSRESLCDHTTNYNSEPLRILIGKRLTERSRDPRKAVDR